MERTPTGTPGARGPIRVLAGTPMGHWGPTPFTGGTELFFLQGVPVRELRKVLGILLSAEP